MDASVLDEVLGRTPEDQAGDLIAGLGGIPLDRDL